ncbi:MAG TPA: zinc metallopeptidase [Syntrophomonadaceae bacterium]|jgi:Zn-dependent membrane protease YugP|nr:zinc metallopeptidase [Syntrophomonadaceae bacterium]
MGYLIFIIPALLISLYAQFNIKSTYKKYSQVRSSRGTTGANAAAALLQRNGLGGKVAINQIPGDLTDNYDPRDNTLNLSQTVYGNTSIAAIGVAAHEVGHAIQHNERYAPLELRAAIVPVANFASSASFPILLVGFLLNSMNLVLVGILLFTAVVVFHLVTLPVEFNASQRAVAQLSQAGLISYDEVPMVKKVLGAAAMTYLAATLTAIANLLYYVMIFAGARDE